MRTRHYLAVISPREVIETTDWKSLYHAYEHAEGTPQRLLGLLSEDPEICGDTLAFLDAAVLHQGTIYPVTAPVAAFVAGILPDERTTVHCESALPWDERSRPLRAGLLEWLGSVAEAATWPGENDEAEGPNAGDDDGEGDEDDAQWRADSVAAVRACCALLPELYFAIKPYLDDTDTDVRQAAAGALGRMMAAPELAEFRGEQVQRLLTAAAQETARERAVIALTLGNWGLAPGSLLTDEDPAVRACAALSPALESDPAALAEIQLALRDPAAADDWFPEWIPQLDGCFRFSLVRTLLRRTTTFDEIADSAVAVAKMSNAYTVQEDWGPMLQRAFPERYIPGQPLTEAQRAFLTAIADNDQCWGSIANPVLFFMMTGLPETREELRALLR